MTKSEIVNLKRVQMIMFELSKMEESTFRDSQRRNLAYKGAKQPSTNGSPQSLMMHHFLFQTDPLRLWSLEKKSLLLNEAG